MLTMVILFAKFDYMKESKILLMEQLSAYVNPENSSTFKNRGLQKFFTSNKSNPVTESKSSPVVESFTVKESELNDFITNKEKIDRFDIVQKDGSLNTFRLLKLDKTEEVEYSYLYPDAPYTVLIMFSLIVLAIFVPVSLVEIFQGTSLTSPELLWALIIVAVHGLLLAVSTYSVFDTETVKQKLFHIKAIEVNPRDFELISNLRSQSLAHDFNDLFELFCEAYWDSKVNHSEEAEKTSKIIVDRIIEKLSIAVESENKEKAMVKDSFDNKWRMIGKEL